MLRALIVGLLAGCSMPASLAAATAAEVQREVAGKIDPADLQEPGNTRLAEGLEQQIARTDLAATEAVDLRLLVAEAWIGAGDAERALVQIRAVRANRAATPAQHERAGLALVALWQHRARSEPEPQRVSPAEKDVAEAFGAALPPRVLARALSADAERQMRLKQPREAMPLLDRALDLLKGQPPAERVPLYVLRLTALEQSAAAAEEIQAWLLGRKDDPAVAQVVESALTSGQRLVGQPAPPLKAKRLDGIDGEIELAQLRGKPVLLWFFASWSRPSQVIAPLVVRTAAAYREKGLEVLGVSLDTKDTLANLKQFAAVAGIGFPVVGQGLGWDSEIDDAFHVESIPHLVLIGADGRVANVELSAPTPDQTNARLTGALDALLGKGAPEQGAIP